MNPIKIYREGADLQIAVKALAMGEKESASSPPEPAAPCGEPAPLEPQLPAVRAGRKIERAVRRMIKPLYLPLRRFFTGQLHQEMKAGHDRLSSELASAVDAWRQESRVLLERWEQKSLEMQQRSDSASNDLDHLTLLKNEIREQRALLNGTNQQLDEMTRLLGDRRHRVCIPIESGQLLIETHAGFLLCAASDHALVVCLVESGDLERGTRHLIQRFLAPGTVFVDVGANVGIHTLAAVQAMQREGRIFAFEPFGPVCKLLERTLWMNHCSEMTVLHQLAASNRKSQQTLFLGATSGHHSLYPLDPVGAKAREQVLVETVTLDGTLPPDLKVDLLKIDAEGAELEIVEGARDVIDRHFDIALIVEFGPSHLKRAGHTTGDWLGAFEAHGLTFRAIHPETGALERITPAALENEFSINLFFAREDSKAWAKAEL